MDSLIDDDRFWIHTSVWVVNHHSRIAQGEGGFPVLADEGGVARVKGERSEGMMVFTDRDLAERFVESMRPGLAVATFRSLEHFGAFLQRAQARGETHIGFDPGENVRFIPIDRILASMAEGG